MPLIREAFFCAYGWCFSKIETYAALTNYRDAAAASHPASGNESIQT
jgi:hypothetical protein